MSNKRNGLTLKHRIGYGAGDCGGVVTLNMITGFMSRYITNILHVDTAVLATMLFVWNIWDAVNDPMMGTMMDLAFAKSKNRKNKFRPWILYSIPVIGIGLIALFTVPTALGGGLPMLAAVFCLKIIYEAGYTMVNIAMGSLLGVMATNDNERAGLSSARGFGSTIGHWLAGMLIPFVIAQVGDNATGYAAAAIACVILGCAIIFIHYSWTEERNVDAQVVVADEEVEKVKVTDILEVFKKNRAYLALCIHSVFICSVDGIVKLTNTYMYADVLGDIGLMVVASAVTTPFQLIALAIAPKLAKKVELVKIIRIALITGIVSYLGLFAAMVFGDVNGYVYVVWSSLAYALVIISVQMQWGLVGESIDYNEYLTGKRTEGSIYGTFSFTRRVGTTISNSLGALMIGWIGYDGKAVAQSAETIMGLQVINLVIPAIFALGSWFAFRFVWNINADVRAQIAAWRESKKAQS